MTCSYPVCRLELFTVEVTGSQAFLDLLTVKSAIHVECAVFHVTHDSSIYDCPEKCLFVCCVFVSRSSEGHRDAKSMDLQYMCMPLHPYNITRK